MVPVCLKRYNIETGGKFPLTVGTCGPVIKGMRLDVIGTGGTERTMGVLQANAATDVFNYYNTIEPTAVTADSIHSYANSDKQKAVDGSYNGFKLRFYASSLTDATIESSSGNLKRYRFRIATDAQLHWIRYFDLTGCYLVKEGGTYVDTGETTTNDGNGEFNATTDNLVTKTDTNDIVYVISHELGNEETSNEYYFLVTDKDLSQNAAYRVMQPNHICMHEFFPKEIYFNTPTGQYTKKPDEDSVYTSTKDFFQVDARGTKNTKNPFSQEGVMSMFVMVDLDKQSNDTALVIRNDENIIGSSGVLDTNQQYDFYFTDGENGKKISVNTRDFENGKKFVMNDNFYGEGILSVSETFSITTNKETKLDPKRVQIGAGLTVASEADLLINDLMEENNVDFTIATLTDDYPLYVAPNYQGVDLFNAVNFLLKRKNRSLIEKDGSFTITDDETNDNYANVVVTDNNDDFQIIEFERETSRFDFFNEITVYGSEHKRTRKDSRSIKEIGRKTLEVFEDELVTQEEVNERASALLSIHTDTTGVLKLTLGHEGISQIRAGDIINVEIRKENIPLQQFMVLEAEHLLTGFIKLTLGQHNKMLEDRFAELSIKAQRLNSKIRKETFQDNIVGLDFLEEIDVKVIRGLIRKRVFTGPTPLGFKVPLNTGSFSDSTIGFGDVTIENLEELEF